jgi:hypothetical protein
MEKSVPLEADSSSVSPEILYILGNPISDYLVYLFLS